MVYSYTVGDLAIAVAYAILDKPDPLRRPPKWSQHTTAVRP